MGEGGGGGGSNNVLCFTSFLLLSVTIVVQQCVRRYFASQSSCSHFHGCMVLHDVCMGMVVLDHAHCHGCMVLHDVCEHMRRISGSFNSAADAYNPLAKLCSAATSSSFANAGRQNVRFAVVSASLSLV